MCACVCACVFLLDDSGVGGGTVMSTARKMTEEMFTFENTGVKLHEPVNWWWHWVR